jgi:hypothetical protein
MFLVALAVYLCIPKDKEASLGERISTVELLVKRETNFYYQKHLVWTIQYKEVNGTEPSSSVSIPCKG